jgi:adenylate cyclase
VVGRVGRGLRLGEVPVDRITAFVRTLHPHVAGRRFRWEPGMEEAAVFDLPWLTSAGPEYQASPVAQVTRTGLEVRCRLEGPTLAFEQLEAFRKDGLTDYVAIPMKFMGGAINSITFATKARGGFTDTHLEALRWIVKPLSRVGETLALMRTAVNLLNTYVGRNAGERILKGKIQVGDTESIRCVIWFSDLRGFTLMSGSSTPAETIAMLNELFECQVASIETNQGEVLKFMGDGMLAIFAIDGQRDAAAAALSAAQASRDAHARLRRSASGSRCTSERSPTETSEARAASILPPSAHR